MIPRQYILVDEAEDRHPHDRATFCRLRVVFGISVSHTLRNWRTRNRLYTRCADGQLYPVPESMGSASMVRRLNDGRLYLLTNGIY